METQPQSTIPNPTDPPQPCVAQPLLPIENDNSTEQAHVNLQQPLNICEGSHVVPIHTQSQNPPIFPSTSARQRSSNVQVDNPELEFNRTALSACRSTITQQEVELKRLKESLALRNKRLLQLESQIGVASEQLSSRNSEQGPEMKALIGRIDTVESKLNTLVSGPGHPSTSIIVNSCHSENYDLKRRKSVGTQTTCGKLVDCDQPSNTSGSNHDVIPDGPNSPTHTPPL